MNEEREKIFLIGKKITRSICGKKKRKHVCLGYLQDADVTFLKSYESFEGISKDTQRQEQGQQSAVVTSHGCLLVNFISSA